MKPKVFINYNNKKINNNKESYHFFKNGNSDELYHFNPDTDIIDVSNSIDIRKKINDLFSSPSFVYKLKVNITLKDNINIIKDIIALKDNNLITLDNEKISINDILDIKKAL